MEDHRTKRYILSLYAGSTGGLLQKQHSLLQKVVFPEHEPSADYIGKIDFRHRLRPSTARQKAFEPEGFMIHKQARRPKHRPQSPVKTSWALPKSAHPKAHVSTENVSRFFSLLANARRSNNVYNTGFVDTSSIITSKATIHTLLQHLSKLPGIE
jgi:hypothetical protein